MATRQHHVWDMHIKHWELWVVYTHFQARYLKAKHRADRRLLTREESTQAQLMHLGVRALVVSGNDHRICFSIPTPFVAQPAVIEMYLPSGAWLFNRDLTPTVLNINNLGWDYLTPELLLTIAKELNNEQNFRKRLDGIT